MSLNDESLNDTTFVNGTNNESIMKNCYRLVVLGAPKVGKTCIIDWFFGKQFKDGYLPTIEDFHRKIYKIKGEIYRLDILDTSGNDPFPAMKKLNIMTGDIFVLVFDINDVDSYVQVRQLCDMVRELKKTKIDSKNSNSVPILILGNKLDILLESKMNKNRSPDSVEMQQITSSNKSCVFYEVSCKSLIGLDVAFEDFFHQANLPVEMIPSKHRRVSLNLDLTKPQFVGHSSQQTVSSTKQKINEANSCLASTAGGACSGVSFGGKESAADVERQGSGKSSAKRSFRKMTFRKHLTEAYGAVWLNARRPSIRAELKLLQLKNSTFIYHQHNQNNVSNAGSLGINGGKKKSKPFTSLLMRVRKLFISCSLSRNDMYNDRNGRKDVKQVH